MMNDLIDIVIVANATPWNDVQACVTAVRATARLPYRLLIATTSAPDDANASVTPEVDALVYDAEITTRIGLQNLAMRATRTEYVVLLDAQTTPHDGWLEPLLLAIKSDSRVGIVGAVTVRPTSHEILQAGIDLNSQSEPLYFAREQFLDLLKVDNIPTHPDAVSRVCMMIRSQVFDELNGFDGSYQGEFEDIDFCLRAKAIGYTIALGPTSIVFHNEPTSLPNLQFRQSNLKRLKATLAKSDLLRKSPVDHESPLVSLLYPAYNDAAFLEQNIGSILNQTYEKWELIIVNDASTDETPEILNKFQSAYPDRIKVIHKDNHDRFEAWSLCYNASKGDYVVVFAADDVLLPWCVEEQVRGLLNTPAAAYAYGDVHRFDENGRLIEKLDVANPEPPFQLVHLLSANYLFTTSILIRRSAVEDSGGWLNREFLYSQDYDLFLRLLYGKEQKHVGRSLIKYRVHSAQLSAVIGHEKMFVSGAAVIRDKLTKWQPENVFPGLDFGTGEHQVAAYQAIREILFSSQTERCGVELDFLQFFSKLIDQPAKTTTARKAKFALIHAATYLLRQRREYRLAAQHIWSALRDGAAFEKDLYRLLWKKSRRIASQRADMRPTEIMGADKRR